VKEINDAQVILAAPTGQSVTMDVELKKSGGARGPAPAATGRATAAGVTATTVTVQRPTTTSTTRPPGARGAVRSPGAAVDMPSLNRSVEKKLEAIRKRGSDAGQPGRARSAPCGRTRRCDQEELVRRALVLWAIAWLLGPALGAWGQEPPAGAPAPAAKEPAEPAPDAEEPLGEDDAMVLNFQGADIREVIHSLAGALGINYQIDPRVEGNITIRTTGKVAREDLFPLFNQILRNNGIAAVRVGEVYQILPIAEAKTRAIRRATRRRGGRSAATTPSRSRSSRCSTSGRTRWSASSSPSSRRAATCSRIHAPTSSW
jgi:hypothetical protein